MYYIRLIESALTLFIGTTLRPTPTLNQVIPIIFKVTRQETIDITLPTGKAFPRTPTKKDISTHIMKLVISALKQYLQLEILVIFLYVL